MRTVATQIAEEVKSIPQPVTFLGAERAGRCVLATDHMLAQLYETPKLPKQPAFTDDIEDDPDATDIYGRMDVMAKIDRLSVFHAHENDIRYDGTPFDPDRPVAATPSPASRRSKPATGPIIRPLVTTIPIFTAAPRRSDNQAS
ncbi:hypothetical protein [Asticcacaulis sp.]|uniref:hypothetical protein n=1 Tax=Asticcacaulis sp. TaxID=1872648 RepID=UPI002B9E0D99|nr:hypothetical protein [Asticcacaulis sp.]HTM80764.1 hypothetical protein [Asticcacaulis sp.]